MARVPKFTPQKSTESKMPWRVNVPSQFSESGKRERAYFATKAAALKFAEQQKTRIRDHGTAIELLTPAQREAATAAFQLMGNVSPSRLIDIVKEHLDLEKRRMTSVRLKELCSRFSDAKAEMSPQYRKQLRSAIELLKPFEDRLVFEITPNDLEPLLAKFPPAARNAHLRVWKAVFNFALKREWCSVSPVMKLDFAEISRTEVKLLSNDEIKRLLKECAAHHRDLLPYHLFGIFAGIRPMELERMRWEQVQLEERHILLPSSVTKTATRRIIEMEKALCVWLRWYRWKQDSFRGPIVKRKNLRTRLRNLRTQAGIERWVQDVMRHTYASNWLANFENLDRLRGNMGHRSDEVFWNHYHRAVLRKEAEAFWSLTPRMTLR